LFIILKNSNNIAHSKSVLYVNILYTYTMPWRKKASNVQVKPRLNTNGLNNKRYTNISL